MFHERKNVVGPCTVAAASRARGKLFVGVMIEMHSNADLLGQIRAVSTTSGFSSRLNCREEQSDENSDDGDDHQ